MKKLLLIICFSTWGLSAQESSMTDSTPIMENDSLTIKPKRISVGVKLGMPNIAGGNIEFVLPVLNNHIAPYGDFSGLNINPDEDTEVGLGYTEFGLNYYFGTQGKGLYLGAGIGNLTTDITFSNQEVDEGINDGVGTIKQKISTSNLKLGIKTSGRFYFRFEIGYGFGDIPGELTIQSYSATLQESETIVEEFPEIPGLSDNGVVIGNIGFGISF